MVRHGAGQLLVQLVNNTDPLKDACVRKRASAAFRNLLCVSVSTSERYSESMILGEEAGGRTQMFLAFAIAPLTVEIYFSWLLLRNIQKIESVLLLWCSSIR